MGPTLIVIISYGNLDYIIESECHFQLDFRYDLYFSTLNAFGALKSRFEWLLKSGVARITWPDSMVPHSSDLAQYIYEWKVFRFCLEDVQNILQPYFSDICSNISDSEGYLVDFSKSNIVEVSKIMFGTQFEVNISFSLLDLVIPWAKIFRTLKN